MLVLLLLFNGSSLHSRRKIYKNVDYLYFSSDMPGLDNYFGIYADEIKNRFLHKDDLVVEIGSNDGILLNYLKDDILYCILVNSIILLNSEI